MNPATPLIDLDANATTAPCEAAVEAMVRAMRDAWANPSSMHAPGQAARRLVTEARSQVARLVGCQPAQIVFTSGASEASHLALHGAVARSRGTTRRRLVVSTLEHPGLRATAQRLADDGVPVDWIPARPDGGLDLDAAAALIGDDVALVSVMAANNETGVCLPVEAVAELCRAAGALLHVDATQALGKSLRRFADGTADLWSVSAHKLHGPKGVGALVLRKGLDWPAAMPGRQERGRRGGTENVPGIAGFGAACDHVAASLAEDIARMARLRDRLQAGLVARVPGVVPLGDALERLPNTLCLRVGTLEADAMLQRLERAGVAASSGSACSAGGTEPSHVLCAMGLDDAAARAGVRLSLHRTTTAAEIDRAIDAFAAAVATLCPAPLTRPEAAVAAMA